ncbi:hypothetical protein T492DRAFT_877151 [Pavlovales sp. CCMP2436]|nr:hypothetical protein T492DRAFT_877151 [Pavlovales sp. CCMP2436]
MQQQTALRDLLVLRLHLAAARPLCLMHVYWFFLLLRIAYNLIVLPAKAHKSANEEYEGDSDDDNGKED